jgi:hypothetical protein
MAAGNLYATLAIFLQRGVQIASGDWTVRCHKGSDCVRRPREGADRSAIRMTRVRAYAGRRALRACAGQKHTAAGDLCPTLAIFIQRGVHIASVTARRSRHQRDVVRHRRAATSGGRRASLPVLSPDVQSACGLGPLRSPTSRRVSIRTAVSTRGRGENADRGTTMPRDAEKHRDAQSGLVYLLTTPFCSTRSARRKAVPGSSNARNRLEVMPKGGLASTRNGRCGHRKSLTSHSTTVTGASAKRRRSSSARAPCSSTATTSAPASTRAAVKAPVPAPTSMTRSRRWISAL